MRRTPALAALLLLAAPALAEPSRDPFVPWERPVIAAGDTPLQRFPLEQLKLRGVLLGASPRALLESPDGITHTARVGDWLGTSWGRITAIRAGAIAVTERFRDPLGGVHEHRAELRLPGPRLSGRVAPGGAGGR